MKSVKLHLEELEVREVLTTLTAHVFDPVLEPGQTTYVTWRLDAPPTALSVDGAQVTITIRELNGQSGVERASYINLNENAWIVETGSDVGDIKGIAAITLPSIASCAANESFL